MIFVSLEGNAIHRLFVERGNQKNDFKNERIKIKVRNKRIKEKKIKKTIINKENLHIKNEWREKLSQEKSTGWNDGIWQRKEMNKQGKRIYYRKTKTKKKSKKHLGKNGVKRKDDIGTMVERRKAERMGTIRKEKRKIV